MTVNELLSFFENYYGEKYTGYFLDSMNEYLYNCSEEFLLAVRKVIVLRYSRSFNKSPDIAVIENNLKEIYQIMTKLQIKNALPEPVEEKCNPETAEKYIDKIKDMFRKIEAKTICKKMGNKRQE